MTVTAADDYGGQASIAVAVAVTDETEPPGRVGTPTVEGVSGSILEITWSEPGNSGPAITDYEVQFRAMGSSGTFIDSGHTGPTRLARLGGLAVSTEYEVQVRATNAEGTGGWSASGTGTTLDNASPVFAEGSSTSRDLAENTPGDHSIGTPVSATDADGDEVTYSLAGPDAGAFTIAAATGQLGTRTGYFYDYESDASHEVTVAATTARAMRTKSP